MKYFLLCGVIVSTLLTGVPGFTKMFEGEVTVLNFGQKVSKVETQFFDFTETQEVYTEVINLYTSLKVYKVPRLSGDSGKEKYIFTIGAGEWSKLQFKLHFVFSSKGDAEVARKQLLERGKIIIDEASPNVRVKRAFGGHDSFIYVVDDAKVFFED